MVVPSMLSMADVMADSGYTEEDVFDCGISGEIGFLVVVPLIGACRVPVEALSHFMAGADDYTAEGMPEHWSGALSGKWTIKRDRLRIHEGSWDIFSDNCVKLAEALDAASQPPATTPSPAPVVPAGASDGLPDPERRLARLRELGGNAKYSRCVWQFKGIGKLVESEKSEGRNRNDEKTIRADLREAAQAEHDAKRAGFGSGLGQR